MPEVCRLGDPIPCGDIMNAGSGNVFANGMPITRVGPDKTVGHPKPAPTPIAKGSKTVFVNNLPVARVGDPIVRHKKHGGAVSVGSSDVSAG